MARRFVGRTEQMDFIAATLGRPRPGPLVVVGERGMGRTSLLARAAAMVDETQDRLVRLEAVPGGLPLAALRPYLPEDFPEAPASGAGAKAAGAAMAARLGRDRRPVLVLDDAHLVDHATMLVLRELHRELGAVVLLSRPAEVAPEDLPDTVDSLRYEPGFRIMPLPPLTVDEVGIILRDARVTPCGGAVTAALHAASGGNPTLLGDLVGTAAFSLQLRVPGLEPTDSQGRWRTDRFDPPYQAALTERGNRRLLGAVATAWQELALDRLTELCRIAGATGDSFRVAPVWAGVLLLRCRGEEGLDFLDGLGLTAAEERRFPRLLLARALLLGLSLGRVDDAVALLSGDEHGGTLAGLRLRAAGAWMLAVSGRTAAAAGRLADLEYVGDREVSLFRGGAAAANALAADRPMVAVSQLRRAVSGVEAVRPDLPWLAPYLQSALIDALLVSGRMDEATALAADFSAARGSSGWPVAVALSTMIAALPGGAGVHVKRD